MLQLVKFARLVQARFGVLPDDFMQPVPRGVAGRVHHDERLVDEPTEDVDDVVHIAEMVRGVEVEPSREYGEAPKRDSFLFDDEVVAPVECSGECLLTVEMTTL